jgi:hypothetical protein
MATQNKPKGEQYVAVGRVIHRSEMAGKSEPTVTYNPGDTIDSADFEEAQIERLLKKGSIKPAKLVKAEVKAREDARTAQQQAEDAAATADAAARAAASTPSPGTEADEKIAAGDSKRK